MIKRRINIRMSGLGGQGVVTSAHVMAMAASKDGRQAISNPFFGAEKRMAPAEAYVRIGVERIYDRGELVYPEVIEVFHPQVITQGKSYTMPFYSGIKQGGLVIINSNMELLTDEDKQRLADIDVAVYYVNATEIALEIASTELSTNMGMIGSVAGITKCVTMEALDLALQDRFGKKYVASGGTATLDQAITKKFAKKELLLAKNLAVVKAALRAAHGEENADELSGYYLALEVKQVHEGMMIAVPATCWDEIARLKTRAFAKTLKKIAAHVDLDQYRKSPRGPKKPPPKKSRYRNGGHVSTYKLLTGADP